jgi:hypothetical protein
MICALHGFEFGFKWEPANINMLVRAVFISPCLLRDNEITIHAVYSKISGKRVAFANIVRWNLLESS